MLREPVAVASWLTLGAVSFATLRLDGPARRMAPVLIALTFLASAAATRYWLRETRSRWQIVAFLVAASLIALEQRRQLGGRAALISWAVWVGCAAVGVMLVRWATEGSPI